MNVRASKSCFVAAAWALLASNACAATTNEVAGSLSALPDAGTSVLRVFGALAIVIGVFLGGVWLFRNWQHLLAKRGKSPQLLILESRPLGHRHGLHVIGYEHQRLLIASSPHGVTLISPLADAAPSIESPSGTTSQFSGNDFKTLLRRAVKPGSADLGDA